jgi:transcriptional regulator with XRE-family HTH domain
MARQAATVRPPSREIVGGNLTFERARAGLSQSGLSDASGVSRQTISEIERGTINTNLDVLDRLAGALGISISRLFIEQDSGHFDDDELARRRSAGATEFVDAFESLDATEELAGRPRKYSNAGRKRLER